WRGLGIYPRLLQAILAREAGEAQRFWIGHVRENRASGRGIVKAGFGTIGATDRGHAQALRRERLDRAGTSLRGLAWPADEAFTLCACHVNLQRMLGSINQACAPRFWTQDDW